MEEKSTSPVPQKAKDNSPVELSFPDAMREVLNGNKITRVSWNNSDFCLLRDSYLSINRNGTFHQWMVNDGDMEATDWIVVPQPN